MTKTITHANPKSFKDIKTQNNNLHSYSRGINFLAKRKHTKTKKKKFKVSKESKGAKSTSYTNHLAIDVTNFHDFDD
jgi:hypothetical protein